MLLINEGCGRGTTATGNNARTETMRITLWQQVIPQLMFNASEDCAIWRKRKDN